MALASPGVAVAVAALGVGAFLLNTLVLLPMFSPTGELIYTGRYAQFGEGLGGALVGMVTNPGKVVAELATSDRIGTWPGCCSPRHLPLRPGLLAVGLPITLANLLSIHVYQHELKWHYTSYLIAVVAMAAVGGAHRYPPARHPHRRSLTVLCFAVAGSVAAGPVAGAAGTQWQGWAADPGPVDAVLDNIPEDAVVVADWAIGPHLSHRNTVYEFPVPFPRLLQLGGARCPAAADRGGRVRRRPRVDQLDPDVAPILDELRADPDFEVIAQSPVVLLRRRSGSEALEVLPSVGSGGCSWAMICDSRTATTTLPFGGHKNRQAPVAPPRTAGRYRHPPAPGRRGTTRSRRAPAAPTWSATPRRDGPPAIRAGSGSRRRR